MLLTSETIYAAFKYPVLMDGIKGTHASVLPVVAFREGHHTKDYTALVLHNGKFTSVFDLKNFLGLTTHYNASDLYPEFVSDEV